MKTAALCLLLCLATLVAFWPALENGFINYDDNLYVTDNPQVKAGLTGSGVAWAFTTGHSANWHPLTWLSHMADCELFGLAPAGHHVTNLALHMANAALLLLLLVRLTGRLWLAAAAAALFALHPTRVESVAWVAERKDVLSTLFWLLTTHAYVGWCRRPGVGRYLGLIVLYALGLMSKPMLVTLPCTLLLLDWWPLGRFDPAAGGRWRTMGRLVIEKLPLFALAAISSVVTFVVQQAGGAVQSAAQFGLGTRLANAINAYATYLGKIIWPGGLAVYYPYTPELPTHQILLSILLLSGVSILALWVARRRPWLPMGWLWFLGTLVPVIGLVQVGGQAMADRYTYVPTIGIFILLAWGLKTVVAQSARRRLIAGIACGLILPALGLLTWIQCGHWRDSITLFTHALEVTEGNNLAHNNLGTALEERGRHGEAMAHYRAALEIHPPYLSARENLAKRLHKLGKFGEAEKEYRRILDYHPDHLDSHCNLGALLGRSNRRAQARKHLARALALDPRHVETLHNLGVLAATSGNLPAALPHFTRAAEIEPRNPKSLAYLAKAYAGLGRKGEARRIYARLLQVEPGNAEAQGYLRER